MHNSLRKFMPCERIQLPCKLSSFICWGVSHPHPPGIFAPVYTIYSPCIVFIAILILSFTERAQISLAIPSTSTTGIALVHRHGRCSCFRFSSSSKLPKLKLKKFNGEGMQWLTSGMLERGDRREQAPLLPFSLGSKSALFQCNDLLSSC